MSILNTTVVNLRIISKATQKKIKTKVLFIIERIHPIVSIDNIHN